METAELFKKVLGDRYIDPNHLINGDTEWVFKCMYNDYALLRQANNKEVMVVAWHPQIGVGTITWGQGHYIRGTYEEGLKYFRKYAGLKEV